MTARVLAALIFGLSLVGAPSAGRADIIQLVRYPGGYFITNAKVRIENGVKLVAYTDQHGRFILNVPHGTYRATVEVGRSSRTFLLKIDGRPEMKVYRLRF